MLPAKENKVLEIQPNATQVQKPFSLLPRNFEEALKLAEYMAKSDFVPKVYQGKPHNILIAVQMGAELGLKPMAALQNISVINGYPCLWGDSMLAIVKTHPDFEYIKEYEENSVAICKLKRRNEPEHTSTFSQEDAKTAGLANKSGPWSQYPKRMRQMRARSWAIRNVFPDALKGLSVAEEVMDIPNEPKFVNSAPHYATKQPEPAPEPPNPSLQFEEAVEELQTKINDLWLDSFNTIEELDREFVPLSQKIDKSVLPDATKEALKVEMRKVYTEKKRYIKQLQNQSQVNNEVATNGNDPLQNSEQLS